MRQNGNYRPAVMMIAGLAIAALACNLNLTATEEPAPLATQEQPQPEPEPVFDRDGVLAYRVIQPPPRADLTINFGLEETEMYRGEGWSWNEEIGGANANWATAQRARVFVPLRQEGDYKLTIAALPFSFAVRNHAKRSCIVGQLLWLRSKTPN